MGAEVEVTHNEDNPLIAQYKLLAYKFKDAVGEGRCPWPSRPSWEPIQTDHLDNVLANVLLSSQHPTCIPKILQANQLGVVWN